MLSSYSHSTLNKAVFRKLVGLSLVLLCSISVLSIVIGAFDISRPHLELLTALNFLALAAVLAQVLPRGIWSISFIFYVTFGVFHAGLILASAMGGITDDDIVYQISFWFDTHYNTHAIVLINLAFIGYAFASILFSDNVSLGTQKEDVAYCRRAFHIGGIGLIGSIFIFFAIAFSTGAASSYGAYLSVVDSIPIVGILFTYIYLLIGLTLVLVVVSYRPGFGVYYFLAFFVWSAMAFRLGLRGEVMFPSAVALALLARRGKPINGALMVVLITVFLVAASIVKNARVSGDFSGDMSLNPMNTVAELGSSLRAVTEVVKWRDTGDDLLLGASYWAPIERQVALVLPQMSRLPALEDDRLLNVKVIRVSGPIGFSLVAEAYINFGGTGVFIIAMIFAYLFAKLDNKPSTLSTDVYIGVALVPVFVMIRNSFAHVPIQIVLGVVLVAGCLFLAKRNRSM
ncbi:O-antigen polysaccharide polymerase Wzy [Agaribacter marinus]|uniref:O-antigen polysaccharide polymerase Wzy n=1 Tax=Agaribacter marinus TaxID=1431249 RepID=UPI0024E04CF7|nr:O-antigen polysaccharide polymerase Wzy [Agaribacter marinus]